MTQASTSILPLVSQARFERTGAALPPAGAVGRQSSPPPQPARTLRPPKVVSRRLPECSTWELPISRYCYVPFSENEASRYSLDSSISCGRPDSIELDPDLNNPVASEFQAGLVFAQQAIRSCVGEEGLSKCIGLHGTAGLEENGSALFELDPLTPSTPSDQPVSEGSGGCTVDSGGDVKLRKGFRVGGVRKGTALISSAFKMLSATVVERLDATSQGRRLASKNSCESPAIHSKAFQDSGVALGARSRHDSTESDSETGLEQLRTGLWSLSSSLQAEQQREGVMDKVPAAFDSSNSGDTMATKLIRLPSYHRNLRKRTYPPRVRYFVPQGSSQPVSESRSLPTSPLLESRDCPSGELPRSRARTTSEGHHKAHAVD